MADETYILTFIGKNNNNTPFTITFGGETKTHHCDKLEPVKLTFKLADDLSKITNPDLFKIELPNGSVIFNLMLERGTIPSTQWSRNIQDSPVELAKL
jgi:hypothetical protein